MTGPVPPPPDDDRLSAWLDGELPAQEAAELEARLAADGDLQDFVAGLASVRSTLRGLPPVDPPPGWSPLLGSTRPWYREAALVAAAAATALGIGGGLAPGPSATPDLAAFVATHQATPAASIFEAGPSSTPTTVDVGPSGLFPDRLDGYVPVAMGPHDDGMWARYVDGGRTISVFVQEGGLRTGGLGPVERLRLDGGPVLLAERQQASVVIAERGDATYTMVGDAMDDNEAMAMAAALPEPAMSVSFLTRVRRGLSAAFDLLDP